MTRLAMAHLIVAALIVVSGCAIDPGAGVGTDAGTWVPHVANAGFPVGASVVLERKADLGNPVTVIPELWTSVGAITIPAGGHYIVTLQIRTPRGTWAESRMVRIGWGRDPDGRDETGYHVFSARPDGHATSESFTHALAGGGILAFEIKLHRSAEGEPLLAPAPVLLRTIVCKAHRTD
jgi:hypothetical protein